MGDNSKCARAARHDGGAMFYFLGLIGSMVFYIQQAHGFWHVVLAILKSLVWPAFVVYDLLKFISA
jgi:hypothetical protein